MRTSEKAFMAQIIELARLCGWRVFHPWLSVRSTPGWPDLVLVRDGVLLALECKTERGQLTSSQEDWLQALAKVCEVRAVAVRPSDWQWIEDQLKRPVRPAEPTTGPGGLDAVSVAELNAEIARLAAAYVEAHQHSNIGTGPLTYPALRDAVRRRELLLRERGGLVST